MESLDSPLPALKFPLRDALQALQESANGPPSVRTAMMHSASAGAHVPYKVGSTAKTRALKRIGRIKRRGEHLGGGYAEQRPMSTPRAPPECDRPRSVPKSVPSAVSRSKVEMIQFTQDAAIHSWPQVQKSQSMPDLSHTSTKAQMGASTSSFGGPVEIWPTWTSAARAVLGHGRRQATTKSKSAQSLEDLEKTDLSELPPAGLSRDSSWCGATLATFPGLPRPVKDWASSGLEFTDGGLGIGSRDNPEYRNFAARSPGFVYTVQSGSVSLWNSSASLPTKQPLSQHTSSASARLGTRRDPQARYERKPGPGYYEVPGFTEELLRKVAKRPGFQPLHARVRKRM